MVRLSNRTLERLENRIAAQNSIIRRAVILAEHADDPVILEMILEIQRAARWTRNSVIEEMQKEKG
jgi:N-methylhydantoinase B/oxoprolinase/acetone carboxylase alpha subunit